MNWKEAKQQLLKDPKVRKAYNRPDPLFWLSKKWTDLKIWFRSQ